MYCIFGASIFYEANKQIIANILHDCAHQMVCCQKLVFAKNLVSRKFPKNLIKRSRYVGIRYSTYILTAKVFAVQKILLVNQQNQNNFVEMNLKGKLVLF